MSRTVPILPCRDLDDVVPFYEALGFRVTYRQARPNPYVALRREDVDLHFFGLPAFDPETSIGSCLVVVPDTRALFEAFAAGLRARYGRLPVAGIPRIARPRERRGAGGGFSVVDPGGNWIRVTQDREGAEDAVQATTGPLDLVLQAAARQADARGAEATAIGMLRAGLERHAAEPAIERLPVLVYLAELLVRTGDSDAARDVLGTIDRLGVDHEDPVMRGHLAEAASVAADIGPAR